MSRHFGIIRHRGIRPMACARRRTILTGCMFLCAVVGGCQQKMANQPSYRPLEYSAFFEDGRAARPAVEGTFEWSERAEDKALLTGRTRRALPTRPTSADDFKSEPPFPLTMEVLERGQQRYKVFCVVCHGVTGEGDGTIVRRGYTRPPSYIADDSRGLAREGLKIRLRDVPIGYFFEVITHGMGAMADYSTQVPPRDRWAIAAYIRALQISQYSSLDQLPVEEQHAAQQALEARP